MFLRTFFASLLSLLFVFFTTLLFAPDLKRIGVEKETALCFKDRKLKEEGWS